MNFLAAIQFLTIIPVPWRGRVGPDRLARAAGYFPVVGLVIGIIIAGESLLLGLILPPAVANALLLVSLVAITGLMHLDGFIDTCDGIAGHRTVAERWRIMRDSRAGSFGIVGVSLLLLLKYLSLGSLPAPLMIPTLLFMPVAGRWATVYAVFAYPYARPSGLGKSLKQGTRWPQFVAATLITVVIAIALMPLFRLSGLIALFGVWLTASAVAAYLKSKLGGLTGDSYGAINEIAEVSVLILVNMLVHLGLA
ncbi:adenosylcobinamide-GDP ribazoletransferase [Chloroflexota bacterium]